ncbi:hypothetical protein Clacol_001619 [Clathrus columnatus]|uniref:Uncharacterized protein n=1 Tax=Clathrus columnatus TaxID=1419009 RepID=A0AAV5A1E4_9AGAM|nr:hypothetical protein Clacol_001619 [Clathrus columnatus]
MSSTSPVSPERSQPVLLYTAEPEDISPSEYLLAYILHNSDAKLAMIHDDDISVVVKALLEVTPEITVDSDGVGSIAVSGESSKAPLSLRINHSVGVDPEQLKTDVDALQNQLAEVRRKISLFQKTGAAADREAFLCAEIEALRRAIEKNQLMDESMSKQPKDVRGKIVQKTSVGIPEGELRKNLDRIPKTLLERLQALNDELAITRKERIAAQANREQLFQERDDLQKRLKEVQENRRAAMEQAKTKEEEENEKKRTEEAFKAECIRKEKQAKEQQQRLEARARLLERAGAPAFLSERRDCNALLTYFSPMVTGTTGDSELTTTLGGPSTLATMPAGTRRDSRAGASGDQLDKNNLNHPGPGWVPLQAKKKADEEFFIAKTNKKNSKSGNGQRSNSNTGAKKVNIPLTIMALLSNCGITPPMTFSDVPSVINEIKRKLQWLDDHETDATASNLATMEASLPPLHLLAQ